MSYVYEMIIDPFDRLWWTIYSARVVLRNLQFRNWGKDPFLILTIACLAAVHIASIYVLLYVLHLGQFLFHRDVALHHSHPVRFVGARVIFRPVPRLVAVSYIHFRILGTSYGFLVCHDDG